MKKVLYDALCPPSSLVEGQDGVRGVAEGDVLMINDLVAQVFPALIRGVQTQLQCRVCRFCTTGNIVDECPSVTAQSRSVAYNPLGVICS